MIFSSKLCEFVFNFSQFYVLIHYIIYQTLLSKGKSFQQYITCQITLLFIVLWKTLSKTTITTKHTTIVLHVRVPFCKLKLHHHTQYHGDEKYHKRCVLHNNIKISLSIQGHNTTLTSFRNLPISRLFIFYTEWQRFSHEMKMF